MQANNIPFAHWVMEQQIEAINRFNARQIVSATRLFRPRIHQCLDIAGVACSRDRQL